MALLTVYHTQSNEHILKVREGFIFYYYFFFMCLTSDDYPRCRRSTTVALRIRIMCTLLSIVLSIVPVHNWNCALIACVHGIAELRITPTGTTDCCTNGVPGDRGHCNTSVLWYQRYFFFKNELPDNLGTKNKLPDNLGTCAVWSTRLAGLWRARH